MFYSVAFLILIFSSTNGQVLLDEPSSIGDSSDLKYGPQYNYAPSNSQSEPMEGNAAPESSPLDERKDQSVEINKAAEELLENVDLEANSGPIASDVAEKSKSSPEAVVPVQDNSDVSGESVEGKSKSQEANVEVNPVSSDESVEEKSKGSSKGSSKVSCHEVPTTQPPHHHYSGCCVPACVQAPMFNPMDKLNPLFTGMMGAAKGGAALPGMLMGKLATGASNLKSQMMSAASNNPFNQYAGVMGSKMATSGETLLKSMSGKFGLLNAYFNSLTTPAPAQCVPMVCRPVLCAPPTTTTTTTTTTKAPITPKPCQTYSYARCC